LMTDRKKHIIVETIHSSLRSESKIHYKLTNEFILLTIVNIRLLFN